jgi:hypothetical protein
VNWRREPREGFDPYVVLGYAAGLGLYVVLAVLIMRAMADMVLPGH